MHSLLARPITLPDKASCINNSKGLVPEIAKIIISTLFLSTNE